MRGFVEICEINTNLNVVLEKFSCVFSVCLLVSAKIIDVGRRCLFGILKDPFSINYYSDSNLGHKCLPFVAHTLLKREADLLTYFTPH